jgi:hypothetical protein
VPLEHEVRLSTARIAGGFKRNSWVKITCGTNVIYRIAKGSNRVGMDREKLWLNYDSVVELGLDRPSEQKSELSIDKCNALEKYVLAPYFQPNRLDRVVFRLNLWIALLGTIAAIKEIMGLLL